MKKDEKGAFAQGRQGLLADYSAIQGDLGGEPNDEVYCHSWLLVRHRHLHS